MRRGLRLARIGAGAAWDRVAESAARARHRPGGLLHDDARVSAATLDLAIARGSRFLLGQQGGDGVLRGFMLFPGASTTWVTAHVALVCEGVPALDSLCERAARHLQSIGAVDGGWGFNRRVGVDCDTTAQALLVLQRFSVRVESFLVEVLASTQLECGGFPTYRRDGTPRATGWHEAHADVSVFVAEALARAGGFGSHVERCSHWLDGCMVEGVLPGYWWSDECYALWAQHRTGRLSPAATPRVEAALTTHRGAPQLAMALAAAVGLDLRDELLVDATCALLQSQHSDGSWSCAPCLRVTSPSEMVARPGARGEVVRDRRRVFSTAHAIAALSSVSARLFPGSATSATRAAPSPS